MTDPQLRLNRAGTVVEATDLSARVEEAAQDRGHDLNGVEIRRTAREPNMTDPQLRLNRAGTVVEANDRAIDRRIYSRRQCPGPAGRRRILRQRPEGCRHDLRNSQAAKIATNDERRLTRIEHRPVDGPQDLGR